MPKFGLRSKQNLSTCHPLLQEIAKLVVEGFDCSVVWGFRSQVKQDEFYLGGTSKVQWPNSKHNEYPAMAMDLAPYLEGKVVWERYQTYFFAGYVKAIGEAYTEYYNELHNTGYKFRLGADWDSDDNVNDQTFRDICHFELEVK